MKGGSGAEGDVGLTFFGGGCYASYGILVPQPGIEPVPLAVKAQNLNHWTTRKSLHAHFQIIRNQWEGGVSGGIHNFPTQILPIYPPYLYPTYH